MSVVQAADGAPHGRKRPSIFGNNGKKRWERVISDCATWSFDAVMEAISSNQDTYPNFKCADVILRCEREVVGGLGS